MSEEFADASFPFCRGGPLGQGQAVIQWRAESRESVFSGLRLNQELFPDSNPLISGGLNILNPFIHSFVRSFTNPIIHSFIHSTNTYLVPSIEQTLI